MVQVKRRNRQRSRRRVESNEGTTRVNPSGDLQERRFVVDETTGRMLLLIVFLALLTLFFWWQTGGSFMAPNNLMNILANASVIGVVSLGQLLVIISGGFDLSVSGTVHAS